MKNIQDRKWKDLLAGSSRKLKVQDITTEIYKTAEEFLEVKKRYDVVISDIDLPGKAGSIWEAF